GEGGAARALGPPPGRPGHPFMALAAWPTDPVRAKLAAANPAAAEEIGFVVAEVVGKIRADAVSQSGDYVAAREKVEALHRAGALKEANVYESAKARRFEETVTALALLSGVPIDVAEAAMIDDQSSILLILAKSAGLCWTTVKFVLLLRAGGHSVSAHELEAALVSYEQLGAENAHLAVRFYQRRRRLAESA